LKSGVPEPAPSASCRSPLLAARRNYAGSTYAADSIRHRVMRVI